MVRAQRGLHRFHDQSDEALGNEQADDNSRSDADQRGDDSLAKLDQVIEERHSTAGFLLGDLALGALRLGGFRHRSVSQDGVPGPEGRRVELLLPEGLSCCRKSRRPEKK